MSALSRRVEKLERDNAASEDENWKVIIVQDGDPEPIIEGDRNVIIVRSVKPNRRPEMAE